jgi:hypothetical protein
MKFLKYALRHKKLKDLLLYEASSNEGSEDCNSISYTLSVDNLSTNSNSWWVVDTPEQAEYVRLNSTKWYNADYDTPEHNFEPDELEVVEIEYSIDIKPKEVKIPTVEEFIAIKYKKDEIGHYNYLMEMIKEGEKIYISWYDYKMLFMKENL